MSYQWGQSVRASLVPPDIMARARAKRLPVSSSEPVAFDMLVQSGYVEPPLGYVSPFTPTNDPKQAILNYRARLGYAGVDYPLETPKTALFWRLLDLLEHPRYATVGFVKGLLEPTRPGETSSLSDRLKKALEYSWSGLTGREEHSVTDILQSYGVTNKFALALGGFAGNVLLDPLTYVSPFKAINKAGVPADTASDIAGDLAKLGKPVPEVITSDVIRDVQLDAWKQAREAVTTATKTGQQVSSLTAKLNAALGVTDTSSDIAKRITDALSNVTWSRNVTKAAKAQMQQGLLSKLADPSLASEVSKLTPKVIAHANALADEFGAAVKGIDIISAAKKLATKTGRGWIQTFGAVETQAKEAAEAVTRITLANGLAMNFAEKTNKTWLTFMGKPLIETTVVKKGIDTAASLAYKKIPAVRKAADVTRRLFSTAQWSYAEDLSQTLAPGAKEATEALKSSLLPSVTREALEALSQQTISKARPLEITRDLITQAARSNRSLPRRSALTVYSLVGEEIYNNTNLSEALLFFKDHLEVLKNNWDDGGAALRKWTQIESTLTPEELQLIKDASGKIDLMMDNLKTIDKTLGAEYLGLSSYMPRAYKFTEGVTEEVLEARRAKLLARGTLDKQVAAILSTKNIHDLPRVIPSVSWALEHADVMKELGIEVVTDARIPLASRIVDTLKNQYTALLEGSLSDLASAGMTSSTARAGWVKIYSALTGRAMWVKPDIAQMVTAMRSQFTTDAGLTQALDYFDEVTNYIKMLQITLNPSAHIRNLTGEAAMNFFAGVSVDSHRKAWTALQKVLSDETIDIAGQSVPVIKLMEMFSETGLNFEGMSKEGITQTLEDIIKDLSKQGGRSVSPVALGRKLSSFTDSYFRLAHFIEGLERGMTPQGAAQWVRMFHVDYSDISMFEKNVMRRLFPYYCFTRKNIPMQVRMLIDNPGLFTGLANLVDSAHRALGNPTTSKFLESNLAIPLYDDGTNILYLNWNLPLSDLGRLQTTLSDTIREFASMFHPALRIPLEMAINKSLSTWQPIERPGKEWVPAFGEGTFNIPARLKYVWSQLGAPWTFRQAIAGPEEVETPGLQQPRQIPLLSSLLPIKNKLQMETARAYEMQELLNEITRRAEARGIYVPSITELRKRRRGR